MEYIQQTLKYETDLMIFIQNACMKYETIFANLCTIFDSRQLYTILIPIFAAFSTVLYQKLLLTCILTDLVTILMKWFLAEKRPSWWYHENVQSFEKNPFALYQTEISCEASPSSPSRHLALTASFLFVLLNEISEQIGRIRSRRCHFLVKYFLAVIYSLIMISLTISRMYFSISLLHQSIFGIFVGIFVAKKICTSENIKRFSNLSKASWVQIEVLLVLLCLALYWVHKYLGDPNWAPKMAFKYCKDPFYLNPDTTLIFGLVRCIGFVLGLLISSPLNRFKDTKLRYHLSIPLTSLLIGVQYYGIYNTPRQYKYLAYYSYTLGVNAICQTFFTYIIPKLCSIKLEKLKNK